ncbi:uncharacterized protein LOC121426751 isoform X1 [Lytechinus variegatus]|uniref:uncharacterized protein LOC121426751 isoform X1 n=1 Tax=Lytechinus variegatus TaxID=7654 RepID=UPI001BB2B6A6|nr:uncharacterized protein LOC121426751 isoform X1 [Lytechinus variegatus]
MTKPTKRLNKRTPTSNRADGSSAGGGRNRSGAGQAKARKSIAHNKYVRVAAIMFLPILFGVFGLIVFPPSFDLSTNNVTNPSNSTKKEPIIHGNKRRNDKTRDKTKKDVEKTQSQTRKDKKSKERISETESFKPAILDSLRMQEIKVEGNIVTPVELTKNNLASPVKVYKIEGFLTDRECSGLMRVHQHYLTKTSSQNPIICFDSLSTLRRHIQDAGMKGVTVSYKDFTEGTACINSSFSERLGSSLTWSRSTSFYPTESKFSTVFEDRVFQATGLEQSNGGKFQVTSYPEGIGYKTHTDCTLGNQDKRDRFATILVYLQDVEEGGETKFPELGISVKPKRGQAIVWNNMNSNGECEPISVHEAAQVMKGHKYIIQRWYYYQSFAYLGRRAPEPALPARAPGQPRVSCDEYEHGSCRWYDEWNNDHLTEYRALQSGLS